MDYEKICEVYEKLESTSKGLEKTKILSEFLEKIKDNSKYISLLKGRVFPDFDSREMGISQQLIIKAISRSFGVSSEVVVEKFREEGDLGLAAKELSKVKKQTSLFNEKLTLEKVMINLQKIVSVEGQGAVDRKIDLILELLNSASPIEAKYIVRTVLADLKIGVGNGILRDSIVEYCFHPKTIEDKKEKAELIQEAYNKSTDFSEVFEKCIFGKLDEIKLSPGKPLKVMLYPKAKDVDDAFRIVGKPAAFEYKYDGFRILVNKEKNGKIRFFTRRLEEVTHQFPDVLEVIKKNVEGESFIIDGEIVGFDPKTKEFKPFQFISQRIRRKYHIEKLVRELPVEFKVFDALYFEGESYIEKTFKQRRNLIEKIVKMEKHKISLAEQLITDDVDKAEKFYAKALEDKQEGLMAKSLTARYKPGARIGYGVKLKPEDKDFDLVITGAEWGTGKRARWLTSFNVACLDDKTGELLELGKVSTGLKEKPDDSKGVSSHENRDLSYGEMTEKMQTLKIKEEGRSIKVKPEIVVTVQYQNIQKSPTYDSGWALRFPRILRLRDDRNKDDIATLGEIEEEAKR